MKTRKVVMTVVLAGTVLTTTGCATFMGESMFVEDDEGRFLMSADAECLRPFGTALNGLVTTEKSDPNFKDAYWQNQDEEVKQKVLRFRPQVIKGGKKDGK